MSVFSRLVRSGRIAALLGRACVAAASRHGFAMYRPLIADRGFLSQIRFPAHDFTRQLNADQESTCIFHVESDDDFQDRVVNSDVPVLADFYADWCGPCRNLGPRLEWKVEGQEGKILLAKINVDHAGDIADEMGVSSIPTVIAFKQGTIVHRFEGDVSDEHIDSLITSLTTQPDDDQSTTGTPEEAPVG